MFYKQSPVKITGYGLAAGCQVFYRKIYGFFLHCKFKTCLTFGDLELVFKAIDLYIGFPLST